MQPRPDRDGKFIVVRTDGGAKVLRWEQVPDDIKALLPE